MKRNPKKSLQTLCSHLFVRTLSSLSSVIIFTSGCFCQPTAAPPTPAAPWFPTMPLSPLQGWERIHHMWAERAAERESEAGGRLSAPCPGVLSASPASCHVAAVLTISWWTHHFSSRLWAVQPSGGEAVEQTAKWQLQTGATVCWMNEVQATPPDMHVPGKSSPQDPRRWLTSGQHV